MNRYDLTIVGLTLVALASIIAYVVTVISGGAPSDALIALGGGAVGGLSGMAMPRRNND